MWLVCPLVAIKIFPKTAKINHTFCNGKLKLPITESLQTRTLAMNTQSRILVISESPLFGYAMKDIFPDSAVDIVGDGVDALYMCYNQNYDLVISDFETPILNISDLLKILRSINELQHLPVMIVKPQGATHNLPTMLNDDPCVKLVDSYLPSCELRTEADHFVHD